MESKGIFFILIIAVAILAVALASIIGYLFIVQGSSNKVDTAAMSATAVKNVPKEADLVNIPLYDGKRYFNLKNDDPKKIAMMQVNVILDCYKTLKEKENRKVIVEQKIAAHSDEIQELVVKFFLTKTIDDVKNVDVMDNAKEELTKEINALLNEGVKKPENVVYKVIFSEWLFQ